MSMEEHDLKNEGLDSEIIENLTGSNVYQATLEEKNLNNDTDSKEKKSIISKIKKYKNEHKVKFYTIVSLIVVALIAIVSITIPVSIHVRRKNLYNKLTYEMQHLNNESVYAIEEIINKLPEDYKETETISSQYKLIKKDLLTLSECSRLTSVYFKEGSGDKVRDAYAQLTLISPLYLEWNIEEYLDSVHIEVLIFDAEWESSSPYYSFKWSYKEDIYDERLSSDIPNNKDSEKSYYFTVDKNQDYIIFGYENKDDESDKFEAFKVSNIRYKNEKYYIDVYCFKNDQKYVFTINEDIMN